MELISSNFKFDFLSKAKFAAVISLALIAYSIYTWVSIGEAKYGVDYKGGHEMIVGLNQSSTTEDLRSQLKSAGIDGAIVQEFEPGSGEFSIKLPGDFAAVEDIKGQVSTAIAAVTPEAKILATNFIGPTIGAELRRKALIAIVVGLVGILGYITYRFEFAFALGAVAALFHDVIVCLGIFLLCG